MLKGSCAAWAAEPADVARIFAIRTGVVDNHLSMQQLAELGVTAQTVHEAMAGGDCLWVAQAQHAILGFAMVDLAEACLFALFVDPHYEGRGAGSALLQRAEHSLFQAHARIWLETSIHSRAAQLYQRRGWQLDQLLPTEPPGSAATQQDAVFVKHRAAASVDS